jgi:transcriptional regulator with XRE-family HTH domain
MALTLREYRENHLNLTPAELADHIGERPETISRWETGSVEDIPISGLNRMAKLGGTTGSQLLQMIMGDEKPMPKALSVSDTWKSAEFTKRALADYLANNGKDLSETSICPELQSEYENIINCDIRKPRVSFVGVSDAGKSTMINALLGAELMQTNWTPTTSITVYIIHSKDRPSFITEDAWVFKTDNDDEAFDLAWLSDEDKCKRLCIAKGGAEIIKLYGTRQGERYGDDAVGAVLFADSEVLQNVILVDLPGFGTGDRDADRTATDNIQPQTDVLIYLSKANGFLTEVELKFLLTGIPTLPVPERIGDNNIMPLGNLFIVASQAHIIGNEYDLKVVLDEGCRRFERLLPGTTAEFFSERISVSGYATEKHLRERFFTYSIERPDLRRDFEAQLRTIIEQLPQRVATTAKQHLKEFSKDKGEAIDKKIDEFNRLLENKEREETELKRLIAAEPLIKRTTEIKRQGILSEIRAYNAASIAEFTLKYEEILTVENITQRIKARGFKKKKEDFEAIANHISAVIENGMNSTLRKYSDELKPQIDSFIAGFESECKIEGKSGISAAVTLDARKIFASGLAGVAVYGGLAIWASTLGNLGGYILVAKGVSLLSTLGISIAGGTATAVAAVSSIGGPVTLGIGLAVIAAAGMFTLLSGGWEKKLAKQLIAAYEKQGALHKYKNIIEKFWINDTVIAFNAAADALDDAVKEIIVNKRALIDNYDVDDIQRRIKAAENTKHFLHDLFYTICDDV